MSSAPPIRFACACCRELIVLDERFQGRTVHCSLCDTAVEVLPPADSGALREPLLAEQMDRIKLTDWDRACARTLLDLRMVPPAALRQAICEVKGSRRGRGVSLTEQLAVQGVLDRKTSLALAEVVKDPRKTMAVRPCPSCFATVAAETRECPFCAQPLSEAGRQDVCPACRRPQRAGLDRCRSCLADLETGLRPPSQFKACPRCEAAIPGKALRCPECAAWQRTLPLAGARARLGKLLRRMLGELAGLFHRQRMASWAGALALVVLGLVAFKAVPVLWGRWELLHAAEELAVYPKGRSTVEIAAVLRRKAFRAGFTDILHQEDPICVEFQQDGEFKHCVITLDVRQNVNLYGLGDLPVRCHDTVDRVILMEESPKAPVVVDGSLAE